MTDARDARLELERDLRLAELERWPSWLDLLRERYAVRQARKTQTQEEHDEQRVR